MNEFADRMSKIHEVVIQYGVNEYNRGWNEATNYYYERYTLTPKPASEAQSVPKASSPAQDEENTPENGSKARSPACVGGEGGEIVGGWECSECGAFVRGGMAHRCPREPGFVPRA